MPKTPEAKAKRRAQIRAAVDRHQERLASLSPMERVAWKARSSLGADFDPYTPEERASLERVRRLRAELEAEVERLRSRVGERLRSSLVENPRLAVFLAELETGTQERVALKPY